MALKIKEFDVNYITAIGGKSVNRLKFANFRYKILMREVRALLMAPEGPGLSPIRFRELLFMEE